MNLVLLVLSFVCFILAALEVKVAGVHMLPVGLCFLVAAALFPGPVNWPWSRKG